MSNPPNDIIDAFRRGDLIHEAESRRRWQQDEDGRIHVTEINGCERKTLFGRFNVPTTHTESLNSKLVKDVGTKFHEHLAMLADKSGFGVRFDNLRKDEPWVVGDDLIVGHPDGLYLSITGLRVVDFKSSKEAGWNRVKDPNMDKPYDVDQLNTYMGLLGVKWGELIYVNQNGGQVKNFLIPFSPAAYERARTKAKPLMALIDKATEDGKIPDVSPDFVQPIAKNGLAFPCYWRTKDGNETFCRFWGHCWPTPKPDGSFDKDWKRIMDASPYDIYSMDRIVEAPKVDQGVAAAVNEAFFAGRDEQLKDDKESLEKEKDEPKEGPGEGGVYAP